MSAIRSLELAVLASLLTYACGHGARDFGSGAGGAGGASGGGKAGSAGAAPSGGSTDNLAGAPGASDAGASGAAPETACSKDSECNDGLACNGTETCQQGLCQAGVAPCANPDPAHCDALCKEVNGAASCVIQGQDKDADGYLSKACATKPGDDCDDAVAAVNPGATEICDHVDNDCNGKVDLSDGLVVSGATVAVGPTTATRGTPTIAWASDRSVYGIVYYDATTSTTSDLYFETVNKTGTITLAPLPFNNGFKTAGTPVHLAWGGNQFGVSWVNADDTSKIYFTTLSSTGSQNDTLALPGQGLYLAATGLARSTSGTWAVLYSAAESSSYFVQTVPALAAPAGGLIPVSPGAGQANLDTSSITGGGSSFAIGYSVPVNTATVSVWDASFTSSTPVTVEGQVPVLGSGSNGFAAAVTPAVAGNPAQFYAFTSTGGALCGPVDLADKNFVPAAIVGTPTGYLVVSSGQVRVQEVLANCTMGALFTVDAGPASNVSIAGSASGYGIVWQDSKTGGGPKRRVFGPDFCN